MFFEEKFAEKKNTDVLIWISFIKVFTEYRYRNADFVVMLQIFAGVNRRVQPKLPTTK